MEKKLYGKFLFNFLTQDAENTAEIMEAGKGYIVPGIVSDDFLTTENAIDKVNELKTVSNIISIGLGGGGNASNWKKVLDIGLASNPGHINQPFERASYTKGYLEGNDVNNQIVNALIKPTGQIGKVQLSTGHMLEVEEFLEMAVSLHMESIKMMPVNGKQHLDELIYLTEKAASKGIRGIEPAGGVDANNIRPIIDGVKDIDIEFFMPHIFGSVIDKESGRTLPSKVREIMDKVEGK